MNELTRLNNFEKGSNGVFSASSKDSEFNYSDGEQTEAQLHTILTQAQDLSSGSAELAAQISDWPTEYHLSSTRANLIRPLDLTGVRRVLELGCGCGSITRFLGEQEGVQVDAIEGSPTRAGLAALRCRDLDNVTISSANFNDVAVPDDYYDLVLFVGVTEYAGRFSERETDQEALQDLLALGQRAVNAEGVVLVAIENRLGLKYLMGANEDHYAVRFVGLDGYQESTGIRTYDRTEWISQITEAGFDFHHFIYPFPDYKVPTVMISDTSKSESFLPALEQVKSRDYCGPFDLGESEHRVWQGLLQANNFEDHANSFLILMSKASHRVDALGSFGVAVYDTPTSQYELPKAVVRQREQDRKRQEHLNAEIIQLRSHSANLEAKVDLMSNSIGWRAMNLVRRLFRKTTI